MGCAGHDVDGVANETMMVHSEKGMLMPLLTIMAKITRMVGMRCTSSLMDAGSVSEGTAHLLSRRSMIDNIAVQSTWTHLSIERMAMVITVAFKALVACTR